ncbi:MAG: autotransporter domain-containing protein [Phascolarctobacterium sp.]
MENVNAGDDNDIVLTGGRVNDYLGVEYVADYKDMNFTGRNLTLEDADGTEKIKTANMKGDITAARHLTADSLTAGGTITANGGLTVGTVEAKALNGGAVEAGTVEADDINVASLEAEAVDAKNNINVSGLLKAKASVSPAMYSLARAARVASGINATNITAGSIEATDVTATGSIVAGSISANTVNANDVTLNNGTSTVGTMTTGSLNIAGNGSLNVTDIKVNDINITSITPGTALNVSGTIQDKSGATKSLSDVFKTTVNEENTALFNTSYVSKAVGNKIVTENNGTKIREQTKSLVETQMASMALTNGSADLVAGAGYTNAAQAVKEAKESGSAASAMVPYAAANYGSMRQESGSYVDVDSANFNIGFAKEVKNGNGTLLFGPMVEYGRGNYESHLDDGTVGSGTGQSFGVGVMARQTNDNGFYYEGSLRYGKSTSTYSSNNLLAGKNISYDNSANYWGAHAGVGKVVELSGDNSLDLYGKLFYTRQGASSVNVDGDTLDFSAVNSKRSRIGFRYIHGTSKVRSVYAGLAWQYEFDGAAHATANGFSTPSPSVKGSSGMLELGVLIAPKASPVSFDLGVSGWAGKQKGYSLNANMCWSF